MQNYKIYGEKVSIVIEAGLGACMAEWENFATETLKSQGVLLYERYGIHNSPTARQERTPQNIADELYDLLQHIEHEEKLIFVGHSQGGLYSSEFCARYPELVKGLVLVDPLSPCDVEFQKKLSPQEYKRSGVDKSGNFIILQKMLKIRCKWLIRKMMRKAPPFYYYDAFTKKQEAEILDTYTQKEHLQTCLMEYRKAHEGEVLSALKLYEGLREIPLMLITHDSELAIRENMEFGNNSRAFAQKVETMWQDYMACYLQYSNHAKQIAAKNSTHFIHLTEPQIIAEAIASMS